ncbi:hypothetical protein [Streptomyces sp. NPDC046887]|uniref:hypothetical protein n=1 Tax=Streptomyces sp. NPDC046887 TaxID=3155472 RepID=UPI0033E2798C
MRPNVPPAPTTDPETARAILTGPFHVALRAALAASGLTLHRVQQRLRQRNIRVGVATLSYWQQGARVPSRTTSLRAVVALEDILGLAPGGLTRHLGGPVPKAARPVARSYRTLLEKSASVSQLLADIDSPSYGALRTVSQLERVRIGARRELHSRESQYVVRAERNGVDRFVMIHQGENGCEPDRMTPRAGDNCRVGRSRWDADSGVLVTELLFDTRLCVGDTHVFGFAVRDGTGEESNEWFQCFPETGGQYVLQVRFDPAALPVRCHRFTQGPLGTTRRCLEQLTLNRQHGTVHIVDTRIRPGTVGIVWDWS